MVFAINPPASGNTFDAFKAKAIQQGGNSTGVTAKLCASVDNNGSPLLKEIPDQPQKGLVTCQYDAARICTYNSVVRNIYHRMHLVEKLTDWNNRVDHSIPEAVFALPQFRVRVGFRRLLLANSVN